MLLDVGDGASSNCFTKVLQANIEVANAHAQNAERSKLLGLCMDLQRSINVMLYSTKATSGEHGLLSMSSLLPTFSLALTFMLCFSH